MSSRISCLYRHSTILYLKLLVFSFLSGDTDIASFPGLLRLQFLIACSMQKRREKAWGISSRDPRHDRQMSSRLLSTAKCIYETNLAFCASYKDGTAESYTKRMKHTQAATTPKGYRVTGVKIPSSDVIISWSEKMALFGVALLISQPSLSG